MNDPRDKMMITAEHWLCPASSSASSSLSLHAEEETSIGHVDSVGEHPASSRSSALLVDQDGEMETVGNQHCPKCLSCNTVDDEECPFSCTFCGYLVCSVKDLPAVLVDEEEEMETVGYRHCPECLTCNIVDDEEFPFSCTFCGYSVCSATDNTEATNQPASAHSSLSSCITILSSSVSEDEEEQMETIEYWHCPECHTCNTVDDEECPFPCILCGCSVEMDNTNQPASRSSVLSQNEDPMEETDPDMLGGGDAKPGYEQPGDSDRESRSSSTFSHQQASTSGNISVTNLTAFKIISLPTTQKRNQESDHEDDEEATSSQQPAKHLCASDLASPSHQQASTSGNSGETNLTAGKTNTPLTNRKRRWESDHEDEEGATNSQQPAKYLCASHLASPSHQQASVSGNSGATNLKAGKTNTLATNRKRRWDSDHEDEEEATSSQQPAKHLCASDLASSSHQQVSTSKNIDLKADQTDKEPHCSTTVLNNHKRCWESDHEDEEEATSSQQATKKAKFGSSDLASPPHQQASTSRNGGVTNLKADQTDEKPHCSKTVLNNCVYSVCSVMNNTEAANQPASETSSLSQNEDLTKQTDPEVVASVTPHPDIFGGGDVIFKPGYEQQMDRDSDRESHFSSTSPYQQASTSRNTGGGNQKACKIISLINKCVLCQDSNHEDEEEATCSQEPANKSKVDSSDLASSSHQHDSTSRNRDLMVDQIDEKPHCSKTVLNNHDRHQESDHEDEEEATSSQRSCKKMQYKRRFGDET